MARIIPTAEKQGPNAVRYTWTGTAPYDIWQDGELVSEQQDLAIFVAQDVDAATVPAIEIRDANSTGDPESLKYSSRIRMQWRGQTDAEYYRIERWDGSAWDPKQVAFEGGSGYYTYTTPAEEDGVEAEWRIVTVDSNGYESTAIEHTETVVANPRPPVVEVTYDAGTGNFTVAVA